jgi:hypothetical protein
MDLGPFPKGLTAIDIPALAEDQFPSLSSPYVRTAGLYRRSAAFRIAGPGLFRIASVE